jgi:hypothetical protein
MEYRSKHYTVVQGIGPHSWKWSVRLDEKTLKSGESKTRASAVINAVWLIDKALAPKRSFFNPTTRQPLSIATLPARPR